MCRGSVLPRNSAIALKNCSTASINSAISTTTGGGADGDRARTAGRRIDAPADAPPSIRQEKKSAG